MTAPLAGPADSLAGHWAQQVSAIQQSNRNPGAIASRANRSGEEPKRN